MSAPRLLNFVLLSSILGSGSPLLANKEPAPTEITLKKLFTTEFFKGESLSTKWLQEGAAYTFLKKGEDESQQIWLAEPDKEPRLLVPSSLLVPPGEEKALPIDNYSFSKDLSKVLIYTNSKRVWRRNSRGDYWFLDLATSKLHQIGKHAQESSLMFAKLSPAGTHVAYVREQNIYLEDLSDQSVRALTTAEESNVFNGRFDWVYEEELGVRDGFRWSPDGTAIAYWQFDESGVKEQILLDHVNSRYPKVTKFGYPKVGEKNAHCRAGIVELASGETTWLDLPGGRRNNYLARMEWLENSQELLLQQLNREQDRLLAMIGKRKTGAVEIIHKERDDAWVEVTHEVFPLQKGQSFTWISEKDGWRHLFLLSRSGGLTQITQGRFDVIRLLKIDAKEEWAYYLASPRDPSQRFLFRVHLESKKRERVTPASRKRGTNSYSISPDGTRAIHSFSHTDAPPRTNLISLPEHKLLENLITNKKLHRRVKKTNLSPTEFFYVDIEDDVSLHARCIKPPNFDPEKKYPLLIYVYGEPAGQVVRDSWGGGTGLWHQMLAQKGYVVMSFDNRGTRAPRGREWRKAAKYKIGILPPADQAAAVRAVLKSRPYLDPTRVGTWGWSGGGSMSLNAIFKFPDLYHTAIAVASVPDQRGYDTIYQERYMGRPKDNPKAFRRGSPIHFAHKLEGNLLLIHGANDDNCHYQTYLRLVDKLITHNKPFTMMTYPRGTHSLKEGPNARRHLYETMTRYLLQHLPPGSEAN